MVLLEFAGEQFSQCKVIAAPERPVQVCHKGKPIEQAKPVQTYANCFVKRNRPAWTLDVDGPAPEPAPSPLKLRALPDDPEEKC